ncbi:MAG: sensor histidine kinase [Pirellulaceae bacterium]
MFERRSLKIPITVGVTMIVTLVVLIVGWILLAVFGATRESQNAPVYWTVLTVGTALFVLLLAGVVIYLVLSIKAVNLNRHQSNFVDSVTHELKSPIASLKLYLQTLGMRHVNEEEREGFVKFMLEDVERLDTLITHLLAVGTIAQDAASKEREAVQLDELVREIAESVCLRHQQDTGILDLELSPCIMQSNRVDLDMIIRNLIDNAVKYADSSPQVHVRLTSTPQQAVLQVSDNGQGIPRNMRRKIFGRFIRLGSELEREQPGTGLGLYIVSTLVRSMGGEIDVSDSRQGGAEFTVKLPLIPHGPEDREALPQTSPKLKTAIS